MRTEQQRITVPGGPGVPAPIELDTTLYLPETVPAPAVLVAHGFGGSKASVDTDARDLAARGFVALAWSARGFGTSGGQIALNSPDYEVADARALVDWLAARPDVVQDGPGDPRVGITGGSYGGAISLLLAGYDRRVDALAPVITWNDLGQALFPNAAAGTPPPVDTPARGAFAPDGVFKSGWSGIFFSAGLGPAQTGSAPSPAGAGADRRRPPPATGAGRRRPGRRPAPPPRARPRPAPGRRPAAASCRRSAPPTPRRPPPGGSPPAPPSCCAARPRPASPTGSPRRRCSCRASRTPCSASTRPTPTPGRSPPPAPRSRWPGSPADTTAAGSGRASATRSATGSAGTSVGTGRCPIAARTRGPASPTPWRAGSGRPAAPRPVAPSSPPPTRACPVRPAWTPSRSRCRVTRRS